MTRRDFLYGRRRSALALGCTALRSAPAAAAARPVPSPAQLEWQRDELAMFLHFGVNTFTEPRVGRRQGGSRRSSRPSRARRAAVGADRAGRRLPRDDPHRQASRRLLPLADARRRRTRWPGVRGAAARATWCASSSTPAAPTICGRACISRRGTATTRSTATRRATTTSTATS